MVSSGSTVRRIASIDEQHSLPARWWPLRVDGRSHKINFVLQTEDSSIECAQISNKTVFRAITMPRAL